MEIILSVCNSYYLSIFVFWNILDFRNNCPFFSLKLDWTSRVIGPWWTGQCSDGPSQTSVAPLASHLFKQNEIPCVLLISPLWNTSILRRPYITHRMLMKFLFHSAFKKKLWIHWNIHSILTVFPYCFGHLLIFIMSSSGDNEIFSFVFVILVQQIN